jgi:hypothetical protein
MDTTLDPKQTDPHHVLAARADEQLAHAHEEIKRADEQIARTNEQLSRLVHEAARRRSRGNRRSLRGRAARAFTGLMLTACICVAAIVWQSSYGDAIRQILVRWAPQLVAPSSLALQNPVLPAQPSPPAVQVAATETAPPQPTPPAQTASTDVAPTAAAMSPDSTQLLQSMARDLATLGQGIEQLKASQEQMALLIAKASDQNLRPQIPAPPPRPTAAPTRKPAPTFRSSQATARPLSQPLQIFPVEGN